MSFIFPIEKGHIMAFARSLGEANLIYFDDEYAAASEVGKVIAPPTFTQSAIRFAPSNPLRPDHSIPLSPEDTSERGEPASVGTKLHAEQHFEYFRPLTVGESLTVVVRPGNSWRKSGRRGGELYFTESFTDFVDGAGEVVVSARTLGVMTSRVVEGA
jgi:acyl dehydratase